MKEHLLTKLPAISGGKALAKFSLPDKSAHVLTWERVGAAFFEPKLSRSYSAYFTCPIQVRARREPGETDLMQTEVV